MKKRFGRGSVIAAWVLSYVLILALPLSINFIATFQLSDAIKQEAYQSAKSLLNQAQSNVETRLDDISNIAQLIKTNSSVERFLTDLSQLDYPADEFNRIMVNLRSYQSSNGLIEQIYIIPHHCDIAVSSGAVLRGAQFAQLMNTYQTSQDGEAFDLRAAQVFGDVKLFCVRSGVSGVKTAVGYVQTLAKRAGSRYDATLLILLNQPALTPNLEVREHLTERPFFIINRRDETVSSISTLALPEELSYAMLEGQPERFSVHLDGKDYTVMQTDSYSVDWKYIMLIPDSVMLQEFYRFQQILAVTTVAAILVGTAFAVYFSRQNYLPLKNLVNIVESQSGRAYERRENEFFFLREATQGISTERKELQARLNRQMGNLRQLFLARLLKNELPETPTVSEGCRLYDVQFISDRFLVLTVCFQSASEMNDLSRDREKQRQKMQIRETIEKSINRSDYGFVVEVDNMQAALVSLAGTEPDETASGRIYTAIEESLRQLDTQGVHNLIVASSGCVHGVAELPKAYVDAYTAAEYCILMNRTGLNHYKDVTFGMHAEDGVYYYYYPLQVETQLSNAIKSGDREQAQSVLGELFRVNFDQCGVPSEIAQCFMFNLTSTIIRIVYELNLMNVVEIGQSVTAIESLLNCRSIPQIRQEMDSVVEKLTDYTREQRAQNTFSADICAYIEENYVDVNLDIPMIAEHFMLTPSYLSKKFKSSMSIGLLDYINQYRAARAAETLSGTQDSIQRIAEACGFLNCNTFIRVFKKYEGVTPGKYREINGER